MWAFFEFPQPISNVDDDDDDDDDDALTLLQIRKEPKRRTTRENNRIRMTRYNNDNDEAETGQRPQIGRQT